MASALCLKNEHKFHQIGSEFPAPGELHASLHSRRQSPRRPIEQGGERAILRH